MQIRLAFSGSGILLPLAYQHQLQGLIYQAMAGNGEYRSFLHESGYRDGSRRFKLFTFGRLEGRYRVLGDRILFPGGFRWELRSADAEFVKALSAGFFPGSCHSLFGSELTVEECTLTDFRIRSDQVRIRLLSPVTAYRTAEDGHTRYYSPEEDAFYRLIEDNARRKWRAAMGCEAPGVLRMAAAGPWSKVVTLYKGTYITAWMGRFSLSGPTALLELLYNTGLGAKSSQGFGMFTLSGDGRDPHPGTCPESHTAQL